MKFTTTISLQKLLYVYVPISSFIEELYFIKYITRNSSSKRMYKILGQMSLNFSSRKYFILNNLCSIYPQLYSNIVILMVAS